MSVFDAVCIFFPGTAGREKPKGMLALPVSKTVEMLNRFPFPRVWRNASRLSNGFRYNNGKSRYFLCYTNKKKAALSETLPSLILAKNRKRGYTKANLRGARKRREPTNNEDEGGTVFPINRRLLPCFRKCLMKPAPFAMAA